MRMSERRKRQNTAARANILAQRKYQEGLNPGNKHRARQESEEELGGWG